MRRRRLPNNSDALFLHRGHAFLAIESDQEHGPAFDHDPPHNSYSIVRFDPQFARVYLDEKAQILEALADASAPAAVELARRVLRRGVAVLAGRHHLRDSTERYRP